MLRLFYAVRLEYKIFCYSVTNHNTSSATVNNMKLLVATIYAALCFAMVTAANLGSLKSYVNIGVVGPSTDSPTDVELRASNNLIGLLEYARRMMTVGINHFIEVTEPFTKDILAPVILESQNGRIEGKVNLMNLVASGAQYFTIHHIGVVVESKRLEFNLSVPEVVIDVDFVGSDLILSNILVFNTSGSLHIVLTNLNMEGAMGVEREDDDPSSHYRVTGLEVTNYVEDVEVNVDGDIPDDILKEVKDALMKAVAETAVDEITRLLSHFTVEQVKTFLEI